MRMQRIEGPRKTKFGFVWYLFLVPTLAGVVLFMAYPILEALRLSFFKSNGTIESWKGLDNYRYVLTNDVFHKAIFNTFFITLFQLLIAIPVAFVVALAINSLVHGKNLLKALFFIPYVTPRCSVCPRSRGWKAAARRGSARCC